MRLAHDVKGYLKDSINRLTVIVVVFGVIICAGLCKLYKEIKLVQQAIIQCEKKIDFRYFNLTRSMEDIFKLKIDTYRGRVEK